MRPNPPNDVRVAGTPTPEALAEVRPDAVFEPPQIGRPRERSLSPELLKDDHRRPELWQGSVCGEAACAPGIGAANPGAVVPCARGRCGRHSGFACITA